MAVSSNALARRWSEHQILSLVLHGSGVVIPMVIETMQPALPGADATDDAPT
jgi:hypothetical protein